MFNSVDFRTQFPNSILYPPCPVSSIWLGLCILHSMWLFPATLLMGKAISYRHSNHLHIVYKQLSNGSFPEMASCFLYVSFSLIYEGIGFLQSIIFQCISGPSQQQLFDQKKLYLKQMGQASLITDPQPTSSITFFLLLFLTCNL